MDTGKLDAYEALVQFLYRAPIGLVQSSLDGAVEMLNPMASNLLMPLAEGWPPALRVLVTTLVATPWMTYVLLPFVTRLFSRWLKAG